jgi:predicted transcriptional regulator
MSANPLASLGRRERQIMEILFRRGAATVAQVLSDLPDPPSYSAVRGMLRLLEEKGMVSHEQDGPRYLYRPTADSAKVSESALRHLVRTFFENSAGSAAAAMLGIYENQLTSEELDELGALIDRARDERRGESK